MLNSELLASTGAYVSHLTEDSVFEIMKVVKNERPVEANKCFVAFWLTYGKMLRPDEDVAFSKRYKGAFVSFDTTWTNLNSDEVDEKCIAYTRSGYKAIEPFAQGSYLQWAGFEEERKSASTMQYDNIEKLISIKTKYDPEFLIPSWIKAA